jgi:exodeoxyribonuclease V beta subunit
MKNLNPIEIPLQGIHTIEASAGTGKTYNLTTLYLRMVTECELPVSRILVVTFTEAAAAELRDRIRRRLNEAALALEGKECDDPLVAELVARIAPDEERRRFSLTQLRSALYGMDEAAIHTIHGFCNRVLRENAFETHVPFDAELITDSTAFQDAIVNDFWRLIQTRYSTDIIRMLLSVGPKREDFNRTRITALDARMATCLEPVDDSLESFSAAMKEWRAALSGLSALIDQCGEKPRKLILGGIGTEGLNKRSYTEPKLDGQWIALLAMLKSEPTVTDAMTVLKPFSSETLNKATRKSAPAISHEFFDVCRDTITAGEKTQQAFTGVQAVVWVDYLRFLQEEQPRRKAMRHIQFFDDLLSHVYDAATGEAGPQFVTAIRSRFPCALIDEFQDTDPIQWEIFRSVYEPAQDTCGLFLIGDPKQAIYRFRRADVYAYLLARERSQSQFSINRNYRSVPKLISAVNTLFSRDVPFVEKAIAYEKVSSGRPDNEHRHLRINDDTSPPLHLLQLMPEATDASTKHITKAAANLEIGRCVTSEIASLINQGAKGNAMIGQSPLVPRDIAILVNTHKQGRLIQEALNRAGVDSVIAGQSTVYKTLEAAALLQILHAVTHCEKEAGIRAALLCDFIGMRAADVDHMGQNDEIWEHTVETFRTARDIWAQRGIAAATEHIFRIYETRAKVLQQEGGERRLTNVLHLIELLHSAATERRLRQQDVLHLLTQKMEDTSEAGGDDDMLRLESDADRVRIVTIHKSKGLEYPVVFCPFLWDAKKPKTSSARPPVMYHDKENHGLVIDFGSADYERSQTFDNEEAYAEGIRLLYVALTRAESRCYIVSGFINSYGESALAYLLHDADISVAGINRQLGILVESHPEEFSLRHTHEIDDCVVHNQASHSTSFAARHFGADEHIPAAWRISSFSSLSADHVSETTSLSDRDASTQESTEPTVLTGIHAFPAGAVPGTAIHAIFEETDFQTDTPRLRKLIPGVLARYGFDAIWDAPVCDMVERVLHKTLPGGFSLSDLTPEHCLKELEFYFPLQAASLQALEDVLETYGYGGALNLSHASTLQGFMKGYIDLIACSEGRYWIVDYKSNRLGATMEEYTQERLQQTMSSQHYRLQYVIYLCALHRYLSVRIGPQYDYETHIGGVYYLFVRGIGPKDETDYGVFDDRPPRACIEAVLQCLDRLAGEGTR